MSGKNLVLEKKVEKAKIGRALGGIGHKMNVL